MIVMITIMVTAQEVPKVWEEKSLFRFRFCAETVNQPSHQSLPGR